MLGHAARDAVRRHNIPHKEIFNSGISQMLAMAASNEALRYVSFPTQVLGKSCKMVPVMAGGILLGGKSYDLVKYLQVALITLGVTVFNFGGKKKGGGEDSAYGLWLIAASLVMDAVTGGLQDRVKASTKALNPSDPKAKPTMHESMFWTNASGCLVAAALGLATGAPPLGTISVYRRTCHHSPPLAAASAAAPPPAAATAERRPVTGRRVGCYMYMCVCIC